jgi:plastocyanin
VAHTYGKSGVDTVSVRIATGSSSSVARLSFTVAAAAGTTPETARKLQGRRVPHATHAANNSTHARRTVRARTAADPAIGIVDFNFTPGSTTVHVGDTVTWTNRGQAPHTATADDRSFDTRTLQKGASASHTFTTPGTFAYICTIHPFMKGTVTVLTAASATGSGASGNGSATTSSSTHSAGSSSGAGSGTSSASGSTLPATGMDALAGMLGGLLLLGIGLGLRRLSARDLDHPLGRRADARV